VASAASAAPPSSGDLEPATQSPPTVTSAEAFEALYKRMGLFKMGGNPVTWSTRDPHAPAPFDYKATDEKALLVELKQRNAAKARKAEEAKTAEREKINEMMRAAAEKRAAKAAQKEKQKADEAAAINAKLRAKSTAAAAPAASATNGSPAAQEMTVEEEAAKATDAAEEEAAAAEAVAATRAAAEEEAAAKAEAARLEPRVAEGPRRSVDARGSAEA